MTCNLSGKDILIENCPLVQKLEHLGTQLPKSNRLNDFWTNVLDAYARFGQKIKVTNCDDTLAEPIFYNNKIRIANNYTSMKSWRGYIFTAVCLCVCVCVCVWVCVCVCLSGSLLVNKIPAKRMHQFGRGFR